jgi:hypothetical protein
MTYYKENFYIVVADNGNYYNCSTYSQAVNKLKELRAQGTDGYIRSPFSFF